MTLWGITITAHAPLFLLGIPLGAALLVYIFRARGSGSPIVTSTLLLLSKLPQYMPARRRFIPPLQFWIELAALTLLSLAAARLISSESGARIAVVIDSSKSMATLITAGEPRLAVAKRLATADVAQSLPTTRFSVFSASNSLQPITGSALSSAGAIRAITTVSQSYSPDQLQQFVTALASSREYNRIWVYTDKTSEPVATDTQVKIVSIPSDLSALTNVWLHSITTTGKSGSSTIEAELLVSSKSSVSTSVSATCTKPQSNGTFELPAVTTTVAPGQIAKVQLGPITQPWSYCKAVAQPSSPAIGDALSIDNEAWIADSSHDSPITLVSALSAQQLGLTAIPGISLAQHTEASKPVANQAIYHRQAPPSVPSQSTLVIFPPKGSLPWRGGATLASERTTSEITRWATSHPLLQYVQPDLLSLPESSVLECPDSSTPILFSARGAVACAGEEGGARYVVTGFEIFPFDGRRSPTLSVLTLNIIRWLFQSGSPVQSASGLGSIKLPASATSARIVAPNQRELSLDSFRAASITEPGVVSIISSAAGATGEQLRAFNAISDAESDTSQASSLAITANKDIPTKPREKFPLEGLLAAMALVVLAGDLVRRIIRRSSWGQV
jgi:hypothetical protein